MNALELIRENVSRVMIGQEEVITLLLAALAAGGHCLLEDYPGTGKTLLSKSLAKSMDAPFSRISFTPDLLPTDVTGLSVYHPGESRFVFREGPIFTGLLLADEINRATPRTQSALLECMGERQVTVDGVTRPLAAPFFVIATQNPVETLGCFPLPEAQLDRFLMKISMQPLSKEEELSLLERFMDAEPLESLQAVAGREDILTLQAACRRVFVHPDLLDYLVSLTQATRSSAPDGFREGVSPRGTLALLRASQGYALVHGRDYLIPEDIRSVAPHVLPHRLFMEDALPKERQEKVSHLLASMPVPTEDWKKP